MDRDALRELLAKARDGEKPDIPADVVGEFLHYEQDTGRLFWLAREPWMFAEERHALAWNNRYAGSEALTTSVKGYRAGALLNRHMYAHRAAWAITFKKWPECIDHINRDRKDNRLINLREVFHFENMQNMPLLRTSKSGITGVVFLEEKKKWVASIGKRGRSIFLGHYETEKEARIARAAAERALGFHENHGRKALIAEGE